MPLFNKNTQRLKPFHLKYLDLCRSKNVHPLPEVKAKNKEFHVLDFYGDRVKVDDWLSISNALYYDTSLHHVAIKLRKNYQNVFENANSLKKARRLNGQPVLLSLHVFSQIVDTVSHMISNNEHLTTLMLEGLPLKENFITYIAKGISSNSSIKNLSFARSALGDMGCEIVCSTVKYLPNIDCLNFSQCQLTEKGAEHIADLIKFQKIVRFTKGWESTLRYRSIDPDTLLGLKRITLNCNSIKDEGLYFIVEILKEDCWIKVLDIQSCDLSDNAAKLIIDCLDFNNTLLMIDLQGNMRMSMHFIEHIRLRLGCESDESSSDGTGPRKTSEPQKVNMAQLKERIKLLEQQLETEVFRRRQAEALNENILEQLVESQKTMSMNESVNVPDGFTLIETEELEKLEHEHEHFRSIVSRINQNSANTILSKFKRSNNVSNRSTQPIEKSKSEIISNKPTRDTNNHKKESKSECRIKKCENQIVPYMEKNIGDTCENTPNRDERHEEDVLKIFMTRKSKNEA